MQPIPTTYFPIYLFIVIAFALSSVMIALSLLVKYVRQKSPSTSIEKTSPYECGFDAFDKPMENARHHFDVSFYLVAILFIIFDLEIAFLFPWAVVLKQIGLFGFLSMMMFLSVLTIGFIYEWRKGALEWE